MSGFVTQPTPLADRVGSRLVDRQSYRGRGLGPVAVTSRCGTQPSTWWMPSNRPPCSSMTSQRTLVELHVREVLEEDVGIRVARHAFVDVDPRVV